MACTRSTRRYRVMDPLDADSQPEADSSAFPSRRTAAERSLGAILEPPPIGGLLAAAGRVVLFHHAGGDAPALANCQAVLFGPGPDVTRALAVSRGPPGAARLRPAGPAGMRKVGRELLAELGGVLGVQVDLIVGVLEREPDGLLGRA